ncbi:MAG: hypothetical protein AAFR81_23140 [Chloroflexota bacterium]
MNNVQLNSEQASGAVFLIGFGLLFITGWWFPGMLFVIAASAIAGALVAGKPWYTAQGAVWMIGLGLIFWLNLSWGIVFVLIGISMLLGWQKNEQDKRKRKNDDYDIV